MRAAAVVMLCAVAAGLLAMIAAATAAELAMTPAERASCQAQGGCEVVSAAWLRAQIRAAFDQGFKAGAETGAKEATSCHKPPMT